MANRNYRIGDARIDGLIEELSGVCTAGKCNEKFRQILTTAVQLGMDHCDMGDYKLIHTTLRELRASFQIFEPYREVRKVMVFGSARTPESDPCYAMTLELSRQLVERGFMMISGAGGGIMEAANRGAGKGNSFGINIKLPFEQQANPYIAGDPKLMNFKYFFTRKLIFIKESDATVLLPGGFGTMDEGYENLTLFQTGKTLPRPIVLLEPENGDYWKSWLDFVDSVLIQKGFISTDDRKLLQEARTVEEARDYILEFYRVYHSLRYVRGKTILRFLKPLSPALVDQLNEEFSDILVQGRIQSSPPLQEEVRNEEYPELPRLVFNFDKRHFGRLNEMIWRINRSFA
ncbi:MAG: TIGR00730 family Rossman fold protein [Nitrospinaceae bacterium]